MCTCVLIDSILESYFFLQIRRFAIKSLQKIRRRGRGRVFMAAVLLLWAHRRNFLSYSQECGMRVSIHSHGVYYEFWKKRWNRCAVYSSFPPSSSRVKLMTYDILELYSSHWHVCPETWKCTLRFSRVLSTFDRRRTARSQLLFRRQNHWKKAMTRKLDSTSTKTSIQIK